MKRTLVTKTAELPATFDSEDDEREWWATHDLSARVWHELRQNYEGLDTQLLFGLTASDAPQVMKDLDLAAKNLGLARRAAKAGREGPAADHAMTSMMFAAAAVEAALNIADSAGDLLDIQRGLTEEISAKALARLDLPADRRFRELIESGGVTLSATDVREIGSLLLRRSVLAQGLVPEAARLRIPSLEDPALVSGPQPADVARAEAYLGAAERFLQSFEITPRVEFTRSALSPPSS